MAKTVVIIPARMASTRLPGKPLADIAGKPMIVHVWEQARAAGLGPVAVATDTQEFADAVRASGGEAIMTRADHPSGSDRVAEAAAIWPDADIIVNVQGDFPEISPDAIAAAARPLSDPAVDIGTLGAEIVDEAERSAPNVVKIVGTPLGPRHLRALYFTRATAPYGDGPLYHHFGLYAFRRAALERFVALPPTTLELRESLEQLRALENGMRIDVALIDHVPLGVDTPESLAIVRQRMGHHT